MEQAGQPEGCCNNFPRGPRPGLLSRRVKKCVYLPKSLVPAPHQDIRSASAQAAAHPCSRHFRPLIFQSFMWASALANKASRLLPLFLENSLCVLQRPTPSHLTQPSNLAAFPFTPGNLLVLQTAWLAPCCVSP